MARTGKTHAVKRVRPQLTTIQKSARREKFVSLTNDINDTRAAYMDEVQGLAKKHGWYIYHRAVLLIIMLIHYRSECWTRRQLYLEFIEDHNETLKHDYSKLTAAQKNAFVIEIMQRRVAKQKIVRDNPKAVQRDMLASFAAMDQEWTALCPQLGIEGFYIAVRGGVEDLSGPKLFFSEKAEKFARAILDSEPRRLALKLEAFVVSGLGEFLFQFI
ncbi:hypothetical protein DEU56DRAFT_747903 [Suillus clintonianus]|uniref:uncharacterized protein n=1 Tax=Suillus clintonianus TaxID=1904413 RepID=UPI001B8854FF|nr:uncharacterized protein DEU56DRAFT_747903 [Suillus clintonianus]KAG2117735.1 hypothetical protein DEU56DRAFT_747903 [Suillus clintonianus]